MTITRRKMVTGLAAGSSAVLLLPRKSWAPPPPPPSTQGVWATHFNGATSIRNDPQLVGGSYQGIKNLPASTPYGALFYFYRSSATTPFNQAVLWFGTQAGYGSLLIQHLVTAPRHGPPVAQLASVFVQNPGGGLPNPNANFTSTPGALLNDNTYHLVAASWDLTVPKMDLRLDWATIGNFPGINSSPLPNGNPYLTGAGGAPLSEMVGNLIGSPTRFYTGDLAELMLFLTNSPVNIDDPAIKAAITDPVTLAPLRHMPDGSDVIPGLIPQIYLSGGKDMFPLNLPSVTWNDGLSGNYTDSSPPSSFYVSAGTLSTAPVDPWGENGTT